MCCCCQSESRVVRKLLRNNYANIIVVFTLFVVRSQRLAYLSSTCFSSAICLDQKTATVFGVFMQQHTMFCVCFVLHPLRELTGSRETNREHLSKHKRTNKSSIYSTQCVWHVYSSLVFPPLSFSFALFSYTVFIQSAKCLGNSDSDIAASPPPQSFRRIMCDVCGSRGAYHLPHAVKCTDRKCIYAVFVLNGHGEEEMSQSEGMRMRKMKSPTFRWTT